MAQADWVAALRPAAELTLLPVALLSTLPFRVQRDSPDAIVVAASEASLSRSSNRTALRQVFADMPGVLLAPEPGLALIRSAGRMHIHTVLPIEITAQQLAAAVAATVAGFAVTLPGVPAGPAEVNSGCRTPDRTRS